MRWRSGWSVLALTIASAGAYAIAWLCQTRTEMNRLGARIPTPWLLVVPITAVYFAWCWAEGVRHVTAGRTSTGTAFLLVLLGPLGVPILQLAFNSLQGSGRARSSPYCRRRRSPLHP